MKQSKTKRNQQKQHETKNERQNDSHEHYRLCRKKIRYKGRHKIPFEHNNYIWLDGFSSSYGNRAIVLNERADKKDLDNIVFVLFNRRHGIVLYHYLHYLHYCSPSEADDFGGGGAILMQLLYHKHREATKERRR